MMAFKHIHMSLAVLTILGFLLRSFWLFTQNPTLQKKLVKIIPHIVDTLLLASGITLMVLTRQYPPTFSWITIKIILIVLYIVFGIFMFRAADKKSQGLFFTLAIASIGTILFLAINKPLLW